MVKIDRKTTEKKKLIKNCIKLLMKNQAEQVDLEFPFKIIDDARINSDVSCV